MNRQIYLDYAKGIGIILVFLGHVLEFTNCGSSGAYTRSVIYSFHMPLFFIISGILLNDKVDDSFNLKEEVKKKIHRLLLPYFSWSLIYIIVIAIYHHRIPMERIFAMLSFRGLAPLWFLAALFFSEIIFLFSIRVIVDKSQCIILIVVLTVISCFLSSLYNCQGIDMIILVRYPVIFLCRFLLSYLFLLIGCVLKRGGILFHKKYFVYSAIIFFVISIFADNKNNMHLFNFNNVLLFIVTGLTGSVCTLFLCRFIKDIFNKCILAKIGENSFDLMLLHYPPVPYIFVLRRISIIVFDNHNTIFILIGTFVLSAFSVCLLQKLRLMLLKFNIHIYI